MFPRHKNPFGEGPSSSYSKKSLNYVTFNVGGEKIIALKTVLVLKNKGFEDLIGSEIHNSEETEITIEDTSAKAFHLFLKYIYTDIIDIPSDPDLLLQEVILAHKYSAEPLESTLVKEISTILDINNVCFFLNGANDHGVVKVIDICHLLVDNNAMEFLSSDVFNDLTQTSLINILVRDSFLAPEVNICKSVAKWCEQNDDVNDLALGCVDLSSLTVSDVLQVLWPTKSENSEKLSEAVSKIVDPISMGSIPKAILTMSTNFLHVKYRAEVVSHLDTAGLLSGNKNIDRYVSHKIQDPSGIVIRLNKPNFINNIRMVLFDYDDDVVSYSYYIATSLDREEWHTIIDYRGYACRSTQNLYFDVTIAHYIKIVGISMTRSYPPVDPSPPEFRLVSFQAFYKIVCPRSINGVIRPVQNVATPQQKAIVAGGFYGKYMIGKWRQRIAHHLIPDSYGLVVKLAQPYWLSSMQLFLAADSNYYVKYRVQTSVDEVNWDTVIDLTKENCRFWQDLRFDPRVVVFIRIQGTHSTSRNQKFYCQRFECPSQGPHVDNSVDSLRVSEIPNQVLPLHVLL